MPWFNYIFPNDPFLPSSYNLASGTPTCTGDTLCAIYTTAAPSTNPAQPVISTQVRDAINSSFSGIIVEGVSKLRPGS